MLFVVGNTTVILSKQYSPMVIFFDLLNNLIQSSHMSSVKYKLGQKYLLE